MFCLSEDLVTVLLNYLINIDSVVCIGIIETYKLGCQTRFR